MAPSDSSPVPRQLRLLSFLSRPGIAHATAGQTRSPRFRRAPFERDVAFDPGRASAPRIRGAAQLPSAVVNASAPAVSVFRGSISHPIRLLCTLRRGRHLPRRNTRYQAGATPYLGRTFTGWIAPASPGALLDLHGPAVRRRVVHRRHSADRECIDRAARPARRARHGLRHYRIGDVSRQFNGTPDRGRGRRSLRTALGVSGHRRSVLANLICVYYRVPEYVDREG